MGIPRRQRQWEIYLANLGEGPDLRILILSSDETNQILPAQVLACEIVPENVQKLAQTPITVRAEAADTGMAEPATISVSSIASVPRGCLIELEGRLETVALRLAVDRGIQVLLGNEPWP